MTASGVIQKVSQFLSNTSKDMDKRNMLSLVAFRMLSTARTSADPFAKVTKMIEELVARLEAEAAAEAEHKAFCDGELKENKLTREKKTGEVSRFLLFLVLLFWFLFVERYIFKQKVCLWFESVCVGVNKKSSLHALTKKHRAVWIIRTEERRTSGLQMLSE